MIYNYKIEIKNLMLNWAIFTINKNAIKEVGEENKQKEETTIPRQIGRVVWALFAFIVIVIVAWLLHRLLGK